MIGRIPTPEEIENELCRRSLSAYIKKLWPFYETAHHIDHLVQKLEAVERGEIKRLIICEPPRHSKSVHVSEFFPPWALGRRPSRQIITACYSGDFAAGWGGKVKEHIEDPASKEIFPGLELKQGTKSKTHFETTSRGEYSAVGIGGAVTGRGADIFIIDDPLKNRKEAESVTIRESIKAWFRSTAYTRLMPDAAIIVMMTRWHIDDLVGWLLKEMAEPWEVLTLPAIAEENDQLGREPGEALWPEKYPIERLEEIKGTLGTYEFDALYQQRPAPIEGGLFKINQFQRFATIPAFPRAIIHSYDTGTKSGADNDPTSFGSWFAYPHGYYLKEVVRERIEHPQRKRMVINNALREKPLAILIEDEGNGTSLIQDLRADPNCRHLNIIPISTQGRSKEVRAIGITGIIESGYVFLPEYAGWLPEFETELKHFPNAEHDDQVDQMTQALAWMRDNKIGIVGPNNDEYDDSGRTAGML